MRLIESKVFKMDETPIFSGFSNKIEYSLSSFFNSISAAFPFELTLNFSSVSADKYLLNLTIDWGDGTDLETYSSLSFSNLTALEPSHLYTVSSPNSSGIHQFSLSVSATHSGKLQNDVYSLNLSCYNSSIQNSYYGEFHLLDGVAWDSNVVLSLESDLGFLTVISFSV